MVFRRKSRRILCEAMELIDSAMEMTWQDQLVRDGSPSQMELEELRQLVQKLTQHRYAAEYLLRRQIGRASQIQIVHPGQWPQLRNEDEPPEG